MILRLLCCLGLMAALGATDVAVVDVDHLPVAAYDCEPLEIVLRSAAVGGVADWRLANAPARTQIERREHDSVLVLRLGMIASGLDDLRLVDGQGRVLKRIVFMRPGRHLRLVRDERGVLHNNGDPVVLVLGRREARADRRWALLRRLLRRAPEPCSVVLAAPESTWGTSPLLAQIAALDRVPVAGQGVVITLDGNDVEVGWKHRDYRKVLAWLVEDLRQRGARRLILVEPVAVVDDAEALQPLRDQVVDVARSYRVEMITQPGLEDRRYWEQAPGIIARHLNETGQRLYRRRYAPVLKPAR